MRLLRYNTKSIKNSRVIIEQQLSLNINCLVESTMVTFYPNSSETNMVHGFLRVLYPSKMVILLSMKLHKEWELQY